MGRPALGQPRDTVPAVNSWEVNAGRTAAETRGRHWQSPGNPGVQGRLCRWYSGARSADFGSAGDRRVFSCLHVPCFAGGRAKEAAGTKGRGTPLGASEPSLSSRVRSSWAGIGRTLSSGYCRLCHGKFSSRSLRNAFGKVPVLGENSEKQRRVDQVFFTDFQRLVGVAVRQDPALPQFVCKKCHAQFYKCRSVLRTFIQRVNASPTGRAKSKGKYVAFLASRQRRAAARSLRDAQIPLCRSGFCRSSGVQAQPGMEGGASCLGECPLPFCFCHAASTGLGLVGGEK
ncbi:hypothetical protein DV515_00013775 [Chloebia gouldiae]|uniref:ZAD domain-containing protein n=1 Tax=Chloebia gouldiae TaxID=44316 RepID=A0A3L8S0A6_CHLGU|nr:hypothetical protein DV515_00013775 [Chloebia gouldiae]